MRRLYDITGRLSLFRHEAVGIASFMPTEGAFVSANQQTQRLPIIPVDTSVATLCGLWCTTGTCCGRQSTSVSVPNME